MTEKIKGIENLHKHLGYGKRSIHQIKRELESDGIEIDIDSIDSIAKENNFRERDLIKIPYRDFSQYGNQRTNRDNTIFTKEGSTEIKKLCKDYVSQQREGLLKWKTTKEVYEILTSQGVETSISTLNRWAKEHNLPKSTMSKSENIPAPYLWRDEDIKNFITETPSIIPEEKKKLTKKYIKEGIVIAKTDNFELVKAQFRAIGNLIESIEKERKVTNQKILENKQEIRQLREEQIEREQFYCVSGEKDTYLRNKLKVLIRMRLLKKGFRWDNASARAKEYSNFWDELEKNCGLRRITNINQREHTLAREFILEKLDDEGIEY